MKTSTLVKRALKNGFKSKPPKGYKYLKELPVGSLLETSIGTRGILLDSDINARVVITETAVKDYPGKKTFNHFLWQNRVKYVILPHFLTLRKIISFVISDFFCMKLENIIVRKVTESEFLGKILFLRLTG